MLTLCASRLVLTAARAVRMGDRRGTGTPGTVPDVPSESGQPVFSSGEVLASRYRVLNYLARGGMGEIYEALDLVLDERIALKTIRSMMAPDARWIERFKREVQLGRKVTHPNVCRLFDLGSHTSSGGAEILFLTMELLAGETLADRLRRLGPFELPAALDLAGQLAAGLAAAHDAGIVHRDLKPRNVILVAGSEGPRAVLSDFGLARFHDHSPGDSRANPGVSMGTPEYLAPELIAGANATPAADIYAFGLVLHEIVTGRRPIAAGKPLHVRTLASGLDPTWEDVIRRCISPSPIDRYRSSREVSAELRRPSPEPAVAGSGTSPIPSMRSRTRTGPVRLAVISILALATIVAGWRLLWRGETAVRSDGAESSPSVALWKRIPTLQGEMSEVALSRDGAWLAYVREAEGEHGVYLQKIGTSDMARLPVGDKSPAFSPDGHWLALSAMTPHGTSELVLFETDTGNVRQLGIGGFAPSWSPGGREITFVATEGASSASRSVAVVDVESGITRLVTAVPGATDPAWSPHGQRIAFRVGNAGLWTVSAEGGSLLRVTTEGTRLGSPTWSAGGSELYYSAQRNGRYGIWSIPIDESTGRTLGPARPLIRELVSTAFEFRISSGNNRLVLVARNRELMPIRIKLGPDFETVLRPAEPIDGALGVEAGFFDPSPDGSMLAHSATGEQDLALMRADGSGYRILKSAGSFALRARWAPDASRIAFDSKRSGSREIWMIRPDDSGLTQVTHSGGRNACCPVWSPDGRSVAYTISDVGSVIVDIRDPAAGVVPVALPPLEDGETTFEAWSWSSDGEMIAGSAAGIVLYDVREQRFRRLTDSGEKPVFLRGGRLLLFLHGSNIDVVDARTGKTRTLVSLAPNRLAPWLSLSAAQQTIYAGLTISAEDIWVADLPPAQGVR